MASPGIPLQKSARREGMPMPAGEPPPTRLTLIGALRRGLRWEEFDALYGPAILARARRDFRLQDCDAENVRQEVLIRVWKGLAGYDPARGRFRAWLYACTRNAVANLCRGRHPAGPIREPVAAVERYAPVPDRPVDEALRALDE